jgi:hypothetical protein
MRVRAIRGQGTFLKLAQSSKLSIQFPRGDERFIPLPDTNKVFIHGLEDFVVIKNYGLNVVLLF